MDSDLIHWKHYLDGYPLCWTMDQEGQFFASSVDKEVTCPECLKIMKEES